MPSTSILLQWLKRKDFYRSLSSIDQDEKLLAPESLEEMCTDQIRSQTSHGHRALNLCVACGTVILSLIATLLILSTPNRQPQHHSIYPSIHSPSLRSKLLIHSPWNYSNPSPCGLSVETARQAGCRWSAMTFAWYPSACFDEQLDREFMGLHEWDWYSTEELKEEDKLPRDEILRGDIRKAYMSMEYHKLHCMYTVRKIYRSLMGVALSDNYILTVGHLEHCEKFVLRDDNPAVKGVAKYLDCVVT